jgi:CubicO group peptidase (beta-lactamase class C family)
VWTSAADLIRYVQLELALGKLPNGKRLVSEENLLARRAPQIPDGEDSTYGMGLEIDRRYGIPVVDHGGSMAGFKSNLYFLPDAGIGAVILTNSAARDVTFAAATYKAVVAKQRERLVVPADPTLVAHLAARYSSRELGNLSVVTASGVTTFNFGGWKTAVASRKNDDGTISFITIDPTNQGFEFVMGERDGKKVLVIRDGQHEYLFTEAS